MAERDKMTHFGRIRLLVDTSSTRSASDHTNPNPKLLERRSTPHKLSHSDIYPQFKPDETYRTLQRSKTLDVVLHIPNPIKGISRIPV
ncbi:unnamed protein product [Rotaria sordida]|uniref:Uncharacterized protein n=1 Tax=Rotaria sordida TaxID=392033 RepID=A0A819CDM4_9BILA|nr:unnamed protein product [Rotaria sordida]